MKKLLIFCSTIALLLCFGLGAYADVGFYDWEISRDCDYQRYVATDDGGVNLRSQPSTDATIYYTIPDLVMLRITSESTNGWGYTEYNGTYGWVALSQLSADYPARDANRTVIVSASDGVNLREGPDVSYAKVRPTIPSGEVLTITSIYTKKNWGYISYNGDSGWIALSEVSDYDPTAAASAEPDKDTEPAIENEEEEIVASDEEETLSDVLIPAEEEQNNDFPLLYIIIALIAIVVVISAAILLIVLLSKSTKKKMQQ